jgi:hypothetical protein
VVVVNVVLMLVDPVLQNGVFAAGMVAFTVGRLVLADVVTTWHPGPRRAVH